MSSNQTEQTDLAIGSELHLITDFARFSNPDDAQNFRESFVYLVNFYKPQINAVQDERLINIKAFLDHCGLKQHLQTTVIGH